MRNRLILIVGNMFANKTGTLMEKVDVYKRFGQKKVLILKPTTDTRSGKGKIKNYHGKKMKAVEIPSDNPHKIFEVVKEEESKIGKKINVIAFDEVQFFKRDSGFYNVVDKLLDDGYEIIASGLLLNFRREPYGSTPLLFTLCQNLGDIIFLKSYCKKCGKEAPLPQRLTGGKPAHYNEPEDKVGGKNTYEARCYECHELPGKPIID